MKKTAILVDAEWFRRVLRGALTSQMTTKPLHASQPSSHPRMISADTFYRNALLALEPADEELLRLFYYDCEPFNKNQTNPIDKSTVRFGSGNPTYVARQNFFDEMARKPFVALRRGFLIQRGWEIKETAIASLARGAPLKATDVKFGLEQKGVDMRIGMDVATLSLKRLVDRILLISGDTDMIPAIKLARREGIQVGVVNVGNGGRLSPSLIEDSDFVRTITPVV